MVEGVIVPIQNPNEIDSKVLNNKVMGKIVKSHFLQQKNHNFFVNQVRKILFISFNQKHFGQYFIKKRSLQNIEQVVRITVLNKTPD